MEGTARSAHWGVGCAPFFFGAAALIAVGGLLNHESYKQRQQQLTRLVKVRGTVLDKASVRVNDPRARNADTRYAIKFTCHLAGGREKDGARLSLSGSDVGWERFVKGGSF